MVAGRLHPAHHLRHEADRRVVEHLADVGREHARAGVEPAPARRVADERTDDPEPMARGSLDLVALLGEQPMDGSADRSVAEERYGNVNRLHSRPRGA